MEFRPCQLPVERAIFLWAQDHLGFTLHATITNTNMTAQVELTLRMDAIISRTKYRSCSWMTGMRDSSDASWLLEAVGDCAGNIRSLTKRSSCDTLGIMPSC